MINRTLETRLYSNKESAAYFRVNTVVVLKVAKMLTLQTKHTENHTDQRQKF